MLEALINSLAQRLVNAGIATLAQIRGCTSEEIEEVRSGANGRLPEAYEIFLRTMGRGAGRFLEGTDIFYPDTLSIRDGAEELLREDRAPFELSASDFVFCSHQGYQFMYFRLDDSNEDPPVYYYIEGSGFTEKKWDHFSLFLLKAVEDQIKSESTSPQ